MSPPITAEWVLKEVGRRLPAHVRHRLIRYLDRHPADALVGALLGDQRTQYRLASVLSAIIDAAERQPDQWAAVLLAHYEAAHGAQGGPT